MADEENIDIKYEIKIKCFIFKYNLNSQNYEMDKKIFKH